MSTASVAATSATASARAAGRPEEEARRLRRRVGGGTRGGTAIGASSINAPRRLSKLTGVAKLEFLFPGQGSQQTGMVDELLQVPELADLSRACSEAAYIELIELILLV